jgi:hypothetical protein
MLQPLLGTTKLRVSPALMVGPPKAPAAFRVSATRQGVIGTKASDWADKPWPEEKIQAMTNQKNKLAGFRHSKAFFIRALR